MNVLDDKEAFQHPYAIPKDRDEYPKKKKLKIDYLIELLKGLFEPNKP